MGLCACQDRSNMVTKNQDNEEDALYQMMYESQKELLPGADHSITVRPVPSTPRSHQR